MLSPGPGRPADFACAQLLDQLDLRGLPAFGVCLGLQAMVEHAGGELALLGEPVHGKPGTVRRTRPEAGLLAGLPAEFIAARYHSLYAVPQQVKGGFEVTAVTADGVVMAIEDPAAGRWAVQFHPESILTAAGSVGHQVIANVLRLCRSRRGDQVYASAWAASWRVMDNKTLAAYLDRIAVARPGVLDEAALRLLHRAHQMAVPFENLSIHLAEPISLDEDDLLGKIITRRRGGFCYELNGAFALLLLALGAKVERVAARVYGDGRLSPPFDHLALVVRLADGGGPWLADVGFGSHSTYPLHYDSRHEQDDPAGRFSLADAGDEDVDVLKNGQPQYRIERRERQLADFVPTCWWQQTSPDSHFTQSTICSRLTDDGRISLSGSTLIRTSGGSRTEEQLPSDDAVLAAYREHFGIALDRVPTARLAY